MENRTLYLECYSGISGDTTVAALLDLGADKEVLLQGLKSLNVDGYRIEIGRRTKKSIEACDFNVILDESALDEEHEEHGHHHDHEHHHDHDHDHNHEHHDHLHYGHHEHRNLYDINNIIDNSSITDNAKEIAKRIFYIIAVAESKAHGKPVEEVHFHEVGAIDSIVDIVATAICIDNLNIKEVIVSELYEGSGQVKCQHGMIPIPVPAVANIVAEHKLPLHLTAVKGEMVTPTGAAIVAALKTRNSLPKSFQVNKIGLGAGKREFEHANVLRAMLIEDTTRPIPSVPEAADAASQTAADIITSVTDHAQDSVDKVWVLEANVDDCSGEALAVAMEMLFKHGAKDVYYTPIFMKKNRPAYLLGVICKETEIEQMEEIIFTHTSTIGIRKYETIRTILHREHKTVETPYGNALVKVCTYKDKKFYYPEYESVKELCTKEGKDYITLYSLVQTIAMEQ